MWVRTRFAVVAALVGLMLAGSALPGAASLRAVADSVTVLAAGEVLAQGTVAEIQNDPRVQEIYLGTPVHEGGR